MLTRAETWAIVEAHVKKSGVVEEEIWGSCVFFHASVRGLYITKNREKLWQHEILREKFSEEGLELLFQILDEIMPGVFHRYEYECAQQNITPEGWENQARLKEFEKVIGI